MKGARPGDRPQASTGRRVLKDCRRRTRGVPGCKFHRCRNGGLAL